MNGTALVATLALLACAAACESDDASTPPAASTGTLEANATIDYIVDGDTVDAVIDGRTERIRLIGIDTPETKRPDTEIECFGPEATAFTESLLPVGTPVRIERDTVNRDDFGRLLGYVYRADDGIFVNYEIVRQGFAQPLTIEPNSLHSDLFVAASRAAERDDLGLWSACNG